MNATKVILDVKGLLTQMYYRGEDPDAIRIVHDGKEGKVNTAQFGFQNWLDEYIFPILQHTPPHDIIAVYDGGNDYRRSILPTYKQRRREEKEAGPKQAEIEFKKLLETSKRFLAALGAVCVGAAKTEADDLIAAIAEAYPDTNKMIHTVDADLLQLSGNRTVVFLRNQPQTDGTYKGVPYNLIRLHKALVGDSSDNYIGVPRFGQKAWEHCVEQFGFDGMEEIDQCFLTGNFKPLAEAVEATKDKILSHLYAHIEEAKIGHQLSSLAPETCYRFRGQTLVWPKFFTRLPSRGRLLAVLTEMECESMEEKFDEFMPEFTLVTKENVGEVTDLFLDCLDETPFFSFDYETVDRLRHPAFEQAMSAQSRAGGGYVDVLSSEIVGMSVNFGRCLQHTIYLSFDHRDTDNLDLQVAKDFLETIIETGRPLVAQNCSFEVQVTKLRLGMALDEPYDTQIMASYVNENDESGLKALSKAWFNYDQTTYKDLLQSAGATDMTSLTGKQVMQYGCDDSFVTGRLFNLFQTIMRMEGVWQFYVDNERAVVHPLTDAFEAGVRVDMAALAKQAERGRKVIDEGMAFLRSELAKHCTEPDFEAAKRLDLADGLNLLEIDKAAGKSTDTALLARREQRTLRWAEQAVYKEYSVRKESQEFLATPGQLNTVVAALAGPDAPKIDSVTKPKINRLITSLKLFRREPMDDLLQFCDLLGESAADIRSRSGERFAALAKFCAPFLGEGRVIEEGDELNLNSPPQMQSLFYCKLGLPVRRRIKVQRGSARDELGLEGAPSTDDKAMKLAIAEDCTSGNEWKRAVLQAVIDVREQQTMFSLYYNPYPLWVHPRDGMIHPSVRNCGTVTRRPSGGNPNILQVKKGETRGVFLPRYDDHVIVACDFNGQELRITGSESRDPVMIEAYTSGGTYTDEDGMVHPVVKDIHSVTSVAFSDEIFKREGLGQLRGLSYDEFRSLLKGGGSKAEEDACKLVRKFAKMVNFLIIYGGQASTLSMNLGIPVAFAEEIMRRVFIAYPRLLPWQQEVVAFGRNHGYVKTAYGNLKHLTSDIRSQNGGLRSRQERQAVNSTVQGTAADVLKVVLRTCHRTRLFHETGSVLIAPVYDEIVASVPGRTAFEYCTRLQAAMNVTPPNHPIPMMAEVSIGRTWGEVEELGDNPSEKKVNEAVSKAMAGGGK